MNTTCPKRRCGITPPETFANTTAWMQEVEQCTSNCRGTLANESRDGLGRAKQDARAESLHGCIHGVSQVEHPPSRGSQQKGTNPKGDLGHDVSTLVPMSRIRGRVRPSETRCKYVPVSSSKTSLFLKVSEGRTQPMLLGCAGLTEIIAARRR